MWADLSGLGVPDFWYYEGCSVEGGYKLRDSFTKSTGHQWTITFNYAQSNAVRMVYQRLLEEFTGEGTEYLFFPANLLLLECQKINLREKGQLKELQAVMIAFEEEFKDYCNAHQWVNADSTARMNDRYGNEIITEAMTLDGASGLNTIYPYKNSHLGT
jgi:hypothetical protein